MVHQPVDGDGKVDHGDLGRRLGGKVRVLQPGGDVHPEVFRVLDGGLAQLDADGSALLERLLLKERLQGGVEELPHILQQDRRAKLGEIKQN